MSTATTSVSTSMNNIECVLTASESFIETLSIQTIDAQPHLVELVIKTQLLNAKDPTEKRIKSRTCIERSALKNIQESIERFLDDEKGYEEDFDANSSQFVAERTGGTEKYVLHMDKKWQSSITAYVEVTYSDGTQKYYVEGRYGGGPLTPEAYKNAKPYKFGAWKSYKYLPGRLGISVSIIEVN